jgi:hypothetical protein
VNGKTLYYYDNRGNNGVNPGRFPVTKIGEYYYSACLDYGENFIENSSGERPDYILQGKSSGTFFYIWGGKP